MTTIIDQLMDSPRLSLYYQQIHALLAAEQEQRQHFYATVTEQEKVEFINGEIIVQSPAKLEHTSATKYLLKLLDTFVDLHGLGYVGSEKMLISLTRNDYEPDICFFAAARAAQFTPDQMQFPAPDFVVEVLSHSTEARDRGVKFDDYAAHRVREYWLIDPATQTVEQYVLEGESYALLTKARSGVLVSAAVSGFEIPIPAIFDKAANLAALRQIIAAAQS